MAICMSSSSCSSCSLLEETDGVAPGGSWDSCARELRRYSVGRSLLVVSESLSPPLGGDAEDLVTMGTQSRVVGQHSRFVQVFVAEVADSSLLLDAKVRQGCPLARALGADTLATVAAVVLQRQREGIT